MPALGPDEVDFLLADEDVAWRREENWLVKEIRLSHFRGALDYVNQVGALAEQEGHHPDLTIHGYRNVTLRMQTHAVGGLTENDLILAAKIDKVPHA